MNEIQKLQPECIWKNFYALTQVPRPSGHLDKIQQFLVDFGKQAGVYAVKDPAGNIHFRKPATPGYENKKGVILQAQGESQGYHSGCRQRSGCRCHHGYHGG